MQLHPKGWLASILFAILFLIWPTFAAVPADVVPSSMTDLAVVVGISMLGNGIVYAVAGTIIFFMRGGILRFKHAKP
jgi:hypothetical protein